MKGISGVIGGVVVIILLLVAVSVALAAMKYAYGVQQIEAKTIMSQMSQPHVAQVSPDSVMASGRLVASYIIYPNGRVALLNETVSGIRSFQSYLDGYPWAIVVFSNGQWINVSNMQIQSDNWLYSGSYLVPYYPEPINTGNSTDLAPLLTDGLRYNYPIAYSSLNVSFLYDSKIVNETLNLSDPLVYALGRILVVPITKTSGWLNFTAYGNGYGYATDFAVLVPNATGTWVAIHVEAYGAAGFGAIVGGYASYSWGYNDSYGIYQYPCPPLPNTTYTFYNSTGNTVVRFIGYNLITPNITVPNITVDTIYNLVRVAIKFTQGQPAQMYLWVGQWNGHGISWDRVLMPSIEAPVGSVIGVVKPVYYYQYKNTPYGYSIPIFANESWQTTWHDVVNSTWPVKIYSVYMNESSTTIYVSNGIMGSPENEFNVYAEPLSPELWNVIEVVPSSDYSETVIFNVTYSI